MPTSSSRRRRPETKHSDPTLKALVETVPADWPPFCGFPAAPTAVRDADVAAVLQGAADKVLHVQDDVPYLIHLDFKASHDSAGLPPLLRLRNAALDRRHGLTVWSVAVILRPDADSPQLTGTFTRQLPGRALHVYFEYDVIRVWQKPVGQILAGGLAPLPLAVLSDLGDKQPSWVIDAMRERLEEPAARPLADELWTATHILLGLRYPEPMVQQLLRGVLGMTESVTYQAIINQGRQEGRTEGHREGEVDHAQRTLLLLGTKRFGRPSTAVRAALQAVTDLGELDALTLKVLTATSWYDLLGLPQPRRRQR